jgi:hypothetical protein
LGQQLSFSAYLAAVLVPGAGGQPNSTVTIQVDDPRPLAKAAEMLETNLGVPINYEDPEYATCRIVRRKSLWTASNLQSRTHTLCSGAAWICVHLFTANG